MTSDKIIAKVVKEYVNIQIDNDRCIDRDYIVHFYQKYKWEDKWWEETVICSCCDFPIGNVIFSIDFCEGQTEVKDITILALYEIGELMRGAFHLLKDKEKQ